MRGNHDVFGAAGRGAALIEGAGFTLLNNAVPKRARGTAGACLWAGWTARSTAWPICARYRRCARRPVRCASFFCTSRAPPGGVRPGTADLILAGHTHAGQFHVPLLERFWMPKLSGRYIHGMYRVHGMPLYVSAGLGESGAARALSQPA